MKTILVTVDGGVATVIDSTVPEGYQVEIIDYDNLREAPKETFARLSKDAQAFVLADGSLI